MEGLDESGDWEQTLDESEFWMKGRNFSISERELGPLRVGGEASSWRRKKEGTGRSRKTWNNKKNYINERH